MTANVNYKNSNTTLGYSHTDLMDLLVRRDIFSQGGLYSWGAGTDGALGYNSTVSRSSPGTLSAMGETSWQKVSMKGRSGAAIRSDGTLWTWGRGNYGVLGYNSATTRSSPGTLSGGGANWEEVEAATGHMVAVKNNGTLWTWGRNANGQLGDGSTTNRSSPSTTTGSSGVAADWRVASAGGESSAAIKIDGTLYTWGDNVSGQLGDGSATDRSSPAQVAGGGTNWDKIAISNLTGAGSWMAAIKTDGTLWTWGGNNSGQLGDGVSTTSRSSPNTVAGGGTTWYQVACGYSHAVATKTDGTLWTWGSNANGGLGVPGAARSSPDSVSGGGTTWKLVGAGNAISAGIKYDGTLWTWGNNTNGQLGDGVSTTVRSSPGTVVGGINNWTGVSLSATTTSGNMVGINQLDLFHFPEIDVYKTPGAYTETIPEGQHTATIEVWGGGGPGGEGYGDGGSISNGGGGGGSGGYSRTLIDVRYQVGKTMAINIGSGGIASVDTTGFSSNVKSGTFTVTTINCTGGNAGFNGDLAGPGLGGAGGTATGGTDTNTTGSTGGSGGAGVGGGIGNPVIGRNGFGYGDGGGGGTPLGAGSWSGSDGANGAVIITYL